MNNIKLDGSSWSIKTEERSRGRMKLTIKLSKDEAQGFKNWSAQVRPDNIAEDEFLKQIFFNGIEFLNHKLQNVAREILANEETRKNLEASGINVQALEERVGKPQAPLPPDGEGMVYDLKTKQRVK
tara:strand:- start:11595 stop:11975 length:381 start_codon:yes stop_codon:yes gene_type:complete